MKLSHQEHEALCRRCGQSCHFAVPVNGRNTIVDDLHCTFLGKNEDGTFFCTVYERRFEEAPWCHTTDEALQDGLLAQDCPYARGVPGYKGKSWIKPEIRERAELAIREQLLAFGVPHGISQEGLFRFLAKTGGGDWKLELNADGSGLIIRPN